LEPQPRCRGLPAAPVWDARRGVRAQGWAVLARALPAAWGSSRFPGHPELLGENLRPSPPLLRGLGFAPGLSLLPPTLGSDRRSVERNFCPLAPGCLNRRTLGRTLLVLRWHRGGGGLALGASGWRRRVEVRACWPGGLWRWPSCLANTRRHRLCNRGCRCLHWDRASWSWVFCERWFFPSLCFLKKKVWIQSRSSASEEQESGLRRLFPQGFCSSVCLENMGGAACEWKNRQCQTEEA